MPIVQIDMLEGRTVEQKREMAKRITDVIVEITQCPPEAITIILRDAPKEHIAKAGVLALDRK